LTSFLANLLRLAKSRRKRHDILGVDQLSFSDPEVVAVGD